MQTGTQTFKIQRSAERYHDDHGWLQTAHSFSFAEYYDPKNVSWGALRVFNDDRIAPGGAFPQHPHRDMEIVSYVLAGELEHKDSMGNHGVVRAGGVQFMSAGTGVRHSEANPSAANALHLVQMWVLPGTNGGAPSYGQKDFTVDDRRNRWLTVASGQPGVAAPIALTAQATLAVARLEDARLTHTFGAARFGFVFCAEGALIANGEPLAAGDAVRIANVSELTVSGSGELILWDVPPAPFAL